MQVSDRPFLPGNTTMASLHTHTRLSNRAPSKTSCKPTTVLHAALTQRMPCTPSTSQPSSSPSASSSRAGRRSHQQHVRMAPMRATAVETDELTEEEVFKDLEVSTAVRLIVNYALEFCRASETYQVHSWMILLAILKHENCTAAKVLKEMGLEDLYGAWHEVLWALNSADGLQPKPFQPEITFADRAYRVVVAAVRFASWNGRKKVQSEDILLALAAGSVLDGLFPDLNLTFVRVRHAVEKHTGGAYVLPEDDGNAPAIQSEDEVF